MHYYQHNIGDFDKATRHLTRIERSVYRDLIELYYDTEFQLNSDITYLCRKILATSEQESTAVEQVLNEFFTLTPDGWYHDRCEDEIEKYKSSKSQKAEAGRRSAAARQEKRQRALNGRSTDEQRHSNDTPTNHKPITNNQETENNLKDIVDSEESEKRKRFTPPTFEEVDGYMRELQKGSAAEAQKFVDFYESKGWMVGKNKMKSWQASVRTWLSKSAQNPQKVSGFNLQGLNYQSGDL